MSLSLVHKLNNDEIKRNLLNFIRDFKISLNLSDAEMAEQLRLTPGNYAKVASGKIEIPLVALYDLLEKQNICFESIMNNTVNYLVISESAKGNLTYLPEKYQRAANSSRRSALYMLNYINRRFGWQHRLSILRKLQLNESVLKNPDDKNNIFLSIDICNSVLKTGSAQDVVEMGRNFSTFAQTHSFASSFKQARNSSEAYEIMFTGILEKYVENNYIWKIKKLNNETCVLSGSPNPDVKSEIGTQIINPAMCHLRHGFISSIPSFIAQPVANVKKISCLCHGNISCDYLITMNHQGGQLLH